MPRAIGRLVAILSCLTLAGAGCESLRGGRATESAPVAGGPLPNYPAQKFVNYLNGRADKLTSLQYNRVSLKVDAAGQTVNMGNSTLACEKPRQFALIGGKALVSELMVLGSNDEELWFYQSMPQRSYFYCRHADLPAVASKLPVPFDPDWVMQALGLYTYPADRDYQVETDEANREYLLSYTHVTPGAQPVRMTVAFAADEQAQYDPQVRRMTITSPVTGLTIATATIQEVSPNTGVPTRVTLDWPEQRSSLKLDLGEPQVNPTFDASQRAYFFARRDFPGVEAVDLRRVQFRGTARAQAPDLPPRRPWRR